MPSENFPIKKLDYLHPYHAPTHSFHVQYVPALIVQRTFLTCLRFFRFKISFNCDIIYAIFIGLVFEYVFITDCIVN